MNSSPKVLIVGGGLAGITLGVLLKRHNVNVLVVEKSKATLTTFKGEYLQPHAVNFLTKHGMDSIFSNTNAGIIKELRFRDLRDHQGKLLPESDLLIKYPMGQVARSLSYHRLQSELRQLARLELGENFLEGATVVPLETNINGAITGKGLLKPKLELKHDGKTTLVHPEWVVGCDGKGSQVRRWIHGKGARSTKNVTLGSGMEYIVGCEIGRKAQVPHRYEVIRTPGQGTFSFFGLGNEKQRLYWNTGRSNEGGRYWKESIHASLKQMKDISSVDHEDVGNPVGAEANSYWYGTPFKGRFVLVGDATSTTTPFGGQGMNAAVKHVEFLAQLFSQGTSERLMEKGLEDYQSMAHRYYNHLGLLNFSLYHLFFSRNSFAHALTTHALVKWEQRPEIKDRVGRLFGGLDQDSPGLLEIYELLGGIPSLKTTQLSNIKNMLLKGN